MHRFSGVFWEWLGEVAQLWIRIQPVFYPFTLRVYFMRSGMLFALCRVLVGVAAVGAVSVFGAGSKSKVPEPPKLELASASALVVDLSNGQEVYASLPDAVVPIASITKLMTAMVVLDAQLPMDQVLPVEIQDTHELRGVFSRVKVNSQLPRRELLRLALMSSENRAAATLAHHYPGGHRAFVAAMNAKARTLGMRRSRFAEPTGLSSQNVSTARDLVSLLKAARTYPLIHQLSTTPSGDAYFRSPNYALSFFNTNPLVRAGEWKIHVSKTGFTDEAGHCLVMLAEVGHRPMAMVFLDSLGKSSRFADATRVRHWVESGRTSPLPADVRSYRQQKAKRLYQVTARRG